MRICLNAHHRENHGIEENYKQQWAKDMNELLTEMKKYTDKCKEQIKELDFEQIKALREKVRCYCYKRN